MFNNWSSENRAVLDSVVSRVLEMPLEKKKPEYDDFCGVFVDGRERGIENIYEYSAFKSFKLFSKYNYPIFALINKNHTKDFLTTQLIKDYRITIIPIEPIVCIDSLKNYTDFMIKQIPFLIPEKFTKSIFFQADGYLLNNGYEDFLEYNYYHFLGAPNRHVASVVFPQNPEIQQNQIVNQNGGFSFRRLDTLRMLSKKYGNLVNYEFGRADFQAAPEDLFWNYTISLEYPNQLPNHEASSIFSQDPLKSFSDVNRSYGFHSCQK